MPFYRSLEHSTILYEAPSASPSLSASSNFASVISDGSQPLLRLQFNRINHDLLATFRMDSDTVQILDIRYPSAPVAELTRSHRSNVNCFSWSPNHPGHICTGGKDSDRQKRIGRSDRDLFLFQGMTHKSSYGISTANHKQHQGMKRHLMDDPLDNPINGIDNIHKPPMGPFCAMWPTRKSTHLAGAKVYQDGLRLVLVGQSRPSAYKLPHLYTLLHIPPPPDFSDTLPSV